MHKASCEQNPCWISAHGQHLLIQLHIRSGAKQTRAEGVFDDRLKLFVAAPPIEGRANLAIVLAIAEALGMPKTRVRLVSGLKSKRKTVLLEQPDLEMHHIQSRLELLGH